MSAPALFRIPTARVLLCTLPEYEPFPGDYPPDPAPPARPPRKGVAPSHAGEASLDDQDHDHARRLVGLMLEALDGRRHPDQLRDLLEPPVYASLLTRRRHAGRTGHRHRLRTLHTCRTGPATLEICATATITGPHRPPRVVALVARAVRRRTGWRCTLFRPLHPPARQP